MFLFFFFNSYLFIISFFLFFLGLCGIIFNYNKNIIIMLISIELCLLSINLNFIFSSLLINDVTGLIFSLFILTVAAAEAAIGLAILVLFFRVRANISVKNTMFLKN